MPITLARAPIIPGQKLECVSYAPFRDGQTPVNSDRRVSAEQIAEDLKQLAKITNCIRTYSVDSGLDQIPAIAQQVGLKVLQGIWLSGNRIKNTFQIDTALSLVKQFPDVISAVVVGNEVLLRGDMTASDLASTIRLVKAQVHGVPVTYADAWKYWLRDREIYEAVDFITIHVLPYWEDFPIPAHYAADYVDTIRKQIAVTFPNKEILIGETGWPSEGRMRHGALPSRVNQALVVSDILALAKAENFRVNLIEAYDQPWKRQLEGAVGGYWGLIDARTRDFKYPPGQPISNFPRWKIEMGAGLFYAVMVFLAARLAQRRNPWAPLWKPWFGVMISAIAGGTLLGFAFEKLLVESLGFDQWLNWSLLLAAGTVSPFVAAVGLLSGRTLPTLIELAGPRQLRDGRPLSLMLGLILTVTAVVGVETALGFVFDPHYRSFPYAALTMAVVPLVVLATVNRPPGRMRQLAECIFAGLFALSALYMTFNEGFSNWQSDWTAAVYVLLALMLWQARGANPNEASMRYGIF